MAIDIMGISSLRSYKLGKYDLKKDKRIASIFLSLLIVSVVFISGPASAVSIGLYPNGAGGGVYNYKVVVDIHANDHLPLDYITIELTNTNESVTDTCYFNFETLEYDTSVDGDHQPCHMVNITSLTNNATFDIGYGYAFGFGRYESDTNLSAHNVSWDSSGYNATNGYGYSTYNENVGLNGEVIIEFSVDTTSGGSTAGHEFEVKAGIAGREEGQVKYLYYSPSSETFTAQGSDNVYPSAIIHNVNGVANGGLTNNQTLRINITANDTFLSSWNLSVYNLTGGLVNSTLGTSSVIQEIEVLNVPADGSYMINLTSRDDSNNANSTAFNISVDTTSPQITINSPATNQTLTSKAITINLTVTEANINTTNISIVNSTGSTINSSANTSTGTVYAYLTVQADGVYSINATSYDLAGHLASSVKTNITIDSTTPTATLNLSDPTPTKAGNVTFTLDFSEAMNQSVNPTVQIKNASTYNVTVLGWTTSTRWIGYYVFTTSTGDGNYTVNITAAKDMAGNTMAQNAANTFLLDTAAPYEVTITLNATTANINESINVSCTATDDLDDNLSISYNEANTSIVGVGRINCTAMDHAGNSNATSLAYIVNGTGVIILDDDVTVDENHTEIIVPANNSNSEIAIPENVTNATLDLSAIAEIGEDEVTAILNGSINVSSNTSVGVVEVYFPSNLTINASTAWDGVIEMPNVALSSSVNVTPDSGKTATVSVVIEVGAGDIAINFDKAVRILIPGQAGKYAGFYRNGSFTKITTACANDSQEAGDNLSAGGDCKIDSDTDMVIWTKHFTSFVTYSQADVPSGGHETRGGAGQLITTSAIPSFWTLTNTITEADFALGYTLALGKNQQVMFMVSNAEHYAGIIDMADTSIILNVSSDPQQFTLAVGQDKKVDVDSDSYYDLYIKLNSITNGMASLTLRGIHESMSGQATTPPVISPPVPVNPPTPLCPENSRRCINGDVQQCINNQWVTQELCPNGCDTSRNECIVETPPAQTSSGWQIWVLALLVLLAALAIMLSRRQKKTNPPPLSMKTPKSELHSKVNEIETRIAKLENKGHDIFNLKMALEEVRKDVSQGLRYIAEGRLEALAREIELLEGGRQF